MERSRRKTPLWLLPLAELLVVLLVAHPAWSDHEDQAQIRKNLALALPLLRRT